MHRHARTPTKADLPSVGDQKILDGEPAGSRMEDVTMVRLSDAGL
jgi:hypothetical protein